jgi:hypothetical protein
MGAKTAVLGIPGSIRERNGGVVLESTLEVVAGQLWGNSVVRGRCRDRDHQIGMGWQNFEQRRG